jgi:hypothetical protein
MSAVVRLVSTGSEMAGLSQVLTFCICIKEYNFKNKTNKYFVIYYHGIICSPLYCSVGINQIRIKSRTFKKFPSFACELQVLLPTPKWMMRITRKMKRCDLAQTVIDSQLIICWKKTTYHI